MQHLAEVVFRQGQAHAEHDQAQQGNDVLPQPLEVLGRVIGKRCEQQHPDGEGIADEAAQAGDGLHGVVIP
nr:hypothetical protein [Bordetella pertussis]